ncbi:MAG: hypothetical protein AAF908_00380 [Pseudomonadota bacterium]
MTNLAENQDVDVPDPPRRSWSAFLIVAYHWLWTRSPFRVAMIGATAGGLPLLLIAFVPDFGLIGSAKILVQQEEHVEQAATRIYAATNGPAPWEGTGDPPRVIALERGYLVDLKGGLFRTINLASTEDARGEVETVCNASPACALFYLKEVGYLSALNWSLALFILFPLTLMFAFRAPRAFDVSIRNMADKGMFPPRKAVQTAADRQAGVPAVRARIWARGSVTGGLLLVLGFLTMALDWHAAVNRSLMCEERGAWAEEACESVRIRAEDDDPINELDWSNAATFGSVYRMAHGTEGEGLPPVIQLIGNFACNEAGEKALRRHFTCAGETASGLSLPDLWMNWVFSAYVYGVAGAMTALLLSFYGYLFAVAWTVEEVSHGRYGRILVPYVWSEDLRRGFEYLWPPVRAVLLTTFAGYALLYLMRVQNLFLRSQTYESIFDYLLQDILAPITDLPKLISGLLSNDQAATISARLTSSTTTFGNILDPGLEDVQAYIAVLVFFFVTIVVAVLLIVALYDVAIRAREDALEMLDRDETRDAFIRAHGQGDLTTQEGLAEAGREMERRLREMNAWPLDWPTLGRMLRLLLIGVLFLMFYRAMLIWLGLFIFSTIRSARAE